MAYLALYREWRPKNFKELVGQEHVRITLTNAMKQNKVAHAYLFSGPRGTGKTTVAKILAKALNCTNKDGVEPCNQCTSCQEIEQGFAMDVLEIDAASNRGIDEIRDLREKVKLVSSGGKYKVYIIDEVHMLTTEAFNALLKTLEEPPSKVVFVLATTEAHKVPLTILSRVQRFEFHRISVEAIVLRLQEVCVTLGREIEEKALKIIAVKAEGSLRDALSILDQCLLHDDPIRVEHVYQVIGMVGETYSAELTESLIEGNYGMTLVKLEEGVSLGRDPHQIIRELLDYFRQTLLFIASGQEPMLAPELILRLVNQGKKIGLSRLLSWINVLLKGEGELRYASNARLAAEMILIQIIYNTDASEDAKKTNIVIKQNPTVIKQTINAKEGIQESSDKIRLDRSKEQVKSLSTQDGFSFAEVNTRWPEVLDEVRKQKKSTHAFLLEGKPVEVSQDSLYLVFKEGYSFHRDKFNQQENKSVVEQVLEQVFGRKLLLTNLIESEYVINRGETSESQGIKKMSKQEMSNLEIGTRDDFSINKAKELFGTELIQVRKGE